MDMRELKLSVTNCYLIETGNKYLLIDTGYNEDWGLFQKRLKEAGVSISDISYILLTHHHDDHCGLLNHILEENQGIRVIMSYRAKGYLLAGKNDQSQGGRFVNKRVKLFISFIRLFDKRWKDHTFPAYQTRDIDILLKGDTCFNDIGIRLDGKIIEAPGHSMDSISIIFADGDCIAGDAAANFPKFLGAKYCVIIIEDLGSYYRSWRKLISEGARKIYPAHGEPFPVEKLEENLDKNREKDMVVIS